MESEEVKISPERAVEILKKDGLQVTPNEAKLILQFLYHMAEMAVDQYLNKSD